MEKTPVAIGIAVLALLIAGAARLEVGVAYIVAATLLVVSLLPAWWIGGRAMKCLRQGEQLRVERFTTVTVHNGPAFVLLNPFGYRAAELQHAHALGASEYLVVKDMQSGEERIVKGPHLFFLGPYDTVCRKGSALTLSETEYVHISNTLTGSKTVVKGPRVWFPEAHENGVKGQCLCLTNTQYVFVDDLLTGERTLLKGPLVWCPKAHEAASAVQTAIALRDDEYLRLKDTATGSHWIQRGQCLVFLQPTWKVDGTTQKALVLKGNQYVRFLDRSTGKVSVLRGEATVFPGPHDATLDGGVQDAVEVDGEHAVLVRDKTTGRQRLVTERQLFVPAPTEVIEEVRELIKLAEHEAMIVKDADGVFHYHYGSESRRKPGEPQAFFLPPGAEIVKIWWSRGPRRERKDVFFERFDLRPHFMKFEFNCRTSDNVELILEGVLFWELVDLPAMFQHTGDTSGDMVYHIRSQFILHVARVTLRDFMNELHNISKTILEEDGGFYAKRGIKVHTLEITRYQCANESTATILEQVIQETTNRMNRLSQAEGDNEVNLYRTQGQVEQARLKSNLMEIELKQTQDQARSAGSAEAERVVTFLERLQTTVPSLDDRIRIWQVLRKTDALDVVSRGGASLYFTPNDVDLSIESRGAQPAALAQ